MVVVIFYCPILLVCVKYSTRMDPNTAISENKYWKRRTLLDFSGCCLHFTDIYDGDVPVMLFEVELAVNGKERIKLNRTICERMAGQLETFRHCKSCQCYQEDTVPIILPDLSANFAIALDELDKFKEMLDYIIKQWTMY